MYNLQPTRSQSYCKVCNDTTWHAEVLIAHPQKGTPTAMRYKFDWTCIRCYHTINNGPLPIEVSDSFCIIADNLHVKPTLHGDRPDITGGTNLPFGNK